METAGQRVTHTGQDVLCDGQRVCDVGHLVTTIGHRVSPEGHRVATGGQAVDCDGQRVATGGQRVTKTGHCVWTAGQIVAMPVLAVASASGPRESASDRAASRDLAKGSSAPRAGAQSTATNSNNEATTTRFTTHLL